ncbi:MAG TPA: dienelactone hydrolase family protein [Ktedonobacteraceae bacterium]|nr:dienelactone hydrolase family protein [Ktedonobacteraceae bacterium]
MCYDDKAIPPQPPGEAGSAHGEDIVLTASDGTRFAAYIARPEKPATAQILIYPDIRGLHGFYKQLALRFAEVGIAALAIDYFGRTAGLTARDDSFEFWPHVQQMQLATFFNDARAGLAYLRTGAGANLPTFLVGFCMGGSLSLFSGTENLDLAGIIPFYAGLSRNMGAGKGTVLEEAVNEKYPVLGLFGGADQGIPVDQVHALDEALDKAGVEHEIVIYPGAPHSFFDRRATDFADASTDAWKRVLAFISAKK